MRMHQNHSSPHRHKNVYDLETSQGQSSGKKKKRDYSKLKKSQHPRHLKEKQRNMILTAREKKAEKLVKEVTTKIHSVTFHFSLCSWLCFTETKKDLIRKLYIDVAKLILQSKGFVCRRLRKRSKSVFP